MPTSGNPAAITALPQPPSTSQKVPMNSAPYFFRFMTGGRPSWAPITCPDHPWNVNHRGVTPATASNGRDPGSPHQHTKKRPEDRSGRFGNGLTVADGSAGVELDDELLVDERIDVGAVRDAGHRAFEAFALQREPILERNRLGQVHHAQHKL